MYIGGFFCICFCKALFAGQCMSIKKEIVKGTLILTAAGIVTRVIGLYNRVFLANIISASELGLYQLIFPVLALCSAVCCYGIESALSKMISELSAGQRMRDARRTMGIGMALAGALSFVLFFIVYMFARPIAVYFLREPDCAGCLKIAAFVIPFSTMHSCTLGYFFGMQKAAVPAMSQLLEQLVRVGTIYGLSVTFYAAGGANAAMAVYGMLAGEVVSCIFTLLAYKISVMRSGQRKIGRAEKAGVSGRAGAAEKVGVSGRAGAAGKVGTSGRVDAAEIVGASDRDGAPGEVRLSPDGTGWRILAGQFWSYACPLTVNRLALTLLQSFEAVLIPMMLRIYYKDAVTSLEIYGVVTAMVFPFIMFPTTVTNSLATMLMPAVSKANEKKDFTLIQRTVSKSVHYCLLIGILSLTVFFVYGRMLGIVIFKNELAGELLRIFALLAPFIYISSSLAGTLNGLGKVKITLVNSMISLSVRILFIVLVVPQNGIRGYLWGQLAGYLLLTVLDGYFVVKMAGLTVDPWKTLVFPAGFAAAAALFSLGTYRWLLYTAGLPPIILLCISCLIIAVFYGICLILTGIIPGKNPIKKA